MRIASRAGSLLIAVAVVLSGSTARAQFAAAPRIQFPRGDTPAGATAADQQLPAIAAGGNVLLAVWSDKRSYPSGVVFGEYETARAIYGLRLGANRVPLDPVPFVITQEAGTQENPQVVWNGTHWLVVFESYDISGTGYYYQNSRDAVA